MFNQLNKTRLGTDFRLFTNAWWSVSSKTTVVCTWKCDIRLVRKPYFLKCIFGITVILNNGHFGITVILNNGHFWIKPWYNLDLHILTVQTVAPLLFVKILTFRLAWKLFVPDNDSTHVSHIISNIVPYSVQSPSPTLPNLISILDGGFKMITTNSNMIGFKKLSKVKYELTLLIFRSSAKTNNRRQKQYFYRAIEEFFSIWALLVLILPK